MRNNFNISLCGSIYYPDNSDPDIILLFDPKLLWNCSQYYISDSYCFGDPEDYCFGKTEVYYSKGYMEKRNRHIEESYGTILNDVLDNLTFWPEIGFYHDIDVKKFITGIVIPKKYIHNKKLIKIISELNIRIFICDKDNIYELDYL